MRVCAIITSFTSGGAEVLVCNLAEAFAADGHDATVLALSDAAPLGNSPEIEAAMMARIVRAGVTARSLGLRNRKNWIAGAIALRRALRAIRPDVIHAHTARALLLIALARPDAPVVLTHHNSRLPFPPWAFRIFDRIVHTYVAISDQCRTQIGRHARRPIRTILNAASDRFQAAAPRGATARDPVILAVGTISAQKDYPTLIRAARPLAARLADSGRRPRIRIAGTGHARAALEALIDAEKAAPYVELLGSRGDVDVLMRDADVFANSSLWEGFSIAMIEASMSGLPIVATDVAGNCELVSNGVNGRLVPPADPAAMAEAIAAVVAEDDAYIALSNGSLQAAKRFSIAACAKAHLGLYRDTLDRPGSIAREDVDVCVGNSG